MVGGKQKDVHVAGTPMSDAQVGGTATTKRVYLFEEGNKDMRMLLGGKGANLCEMTSLGLPVPPGFVISTKCCKEFFNCGKKNMPPGLREEYDEAMRHIEAKMGKKFGDRDDPLLVSVRSGAPASMPGMMDTVLNLGLSDAAVKSLSNRSGNPRWALDVQRRFIQMFSNVVMGVNGDVFEEALSEVKREAGVRLDIELTADNLKEVVSRFKAINPNIPEDPARQLEMAVMSVFSSWFNPRAIRYRSYNNIPNDWGTAVNVQVMVFGNVNNNSGTGGKTCSLGSS
ncbi:unnamed protein product [Discosporangium mesarthrocarpum]